MNCRKEYWILVLCAPLTLGQSSTASGQVVPDWITLNGNIREVGLNWFVPTVGDSLAIYGFADVSRSPAFQALAARNPGAEFTFALTGMVCTRYEETHSPPNQSYWSRRQGTYEGPGWLTIVMDGTPDADLLLPGSFCDGVVLLAGPVQPFFLTSEDFATSSHISIAGGQMHFVTGTEVESTWNLNGVPYLILADGHWEPGIKVPGDPDYEGKAQLNFRNTGLTPVISSTWSAIKTLYR